MAVPEDFLDELRRVTAMPSLVGREVAIEKRGRVWRGLCLFHEETSPSFYAYDGGFHCFGCGAHRDAIDFIVRTRSIPFDEAARQPGRSRGPRSSRALIASTA